MEDKKLLGYMRVSSREQNEDRQRIALLSYVAENERLNIRQRQAEGIAAAKARGVKFGRPPKPLPDNFYEIYKAWKNKKLTQKQAANETFEKEYRLPVIFLQKPVSGLGISSLDDLYLRNCQFSIIIDNKKIS